MPDKVALARSGDFKFAVKVTVLDHFDPVVLPNPLCASLEVNGIYRLQQIIKGLAANGINGVVLIGGVEHHIKISIIKSVYEVQSGLKGHPNVYKDDVGPSTSNGIVSDAGIWRLVYDSDEWTVAFKLTVQYLTSGCFIINDDGIELGIHWRTIWLSHNRCFLQRYNIKYTHSTR
jgi:hypothetical protein